MIQISRGYSAGKPNLHHKRVRQNLNTEIICKVDVHQNNKDYLSVFKDSLLIVRNEGVVNKFETQCRNVTSSGHRVIPFTLREMSHSHLELTK